MLTYSEFTTNDPLIKLQLQNLSLLQNAAEQLHSYIITMSYPCFIGNLRTSIKMRIYTSQKDPEPDNLRLQARDLREVLRLFILLYLYLNIFLHMNSSVVNQRRLLKRNLIHSCFMSLLKKA